DFLHYDRVGAAQQIEPLAGYLADDADRETGAWERFALDNFGRQPELASERANFILEEQAKRFDEFQLHPLRQTTDVVMTLDDRGRTLERHRFDDVGIECALPQKSRPADHLFGLEHLDKGGADDLPLVLWIQHPGKPLQEEIGSVDNFQVHSALPNEDLFHALALAGPRQPGIHVNAFEAGANGAMDESGGHCRVDAARQRHQHA